MITNLDNLTSHAQEFGKRFIAPITESVDKEGVFPKDAYDALRKEGYMGLLVPKEYNGLGGKAIHHANVCYTLAQFDATTALCYMMHNTSISAVSAFGSSELKLEILPQVVKGDKAFALAYSESGSGTHFGLPDITESEENGRRVLRGRKSFVTSAQYADYYLTYTNSCNLKDKKNTWVVDRTLPNIVHEEGVWNGLGMRGNASKPVQYNGVSVDTKYLLGNDGDGEVHSPLVAMYFVIGLSAVYSGLSKATFDCILEHTKNRQYTNGEKLSDISLVRIHLAEIYTKLQSSLALTLEAAQSFDKNESNYASKIFAARINATHNVMDICSLAMRLGGGKAYSKMLPLERYLRDSFASQVMAPSLDVLKVWLGDEIIK